MLIFRHGLLLLALYDVILALAGTQKPQPPAVQSLCLHGDANEKRPNLMRGRELNGMFQAEELHQGQV